MTFSLLLNDAGDFEGGGTFFEEDGRVYRPQQGVAVLHSGKRRHGGYPISSGLTHTNPGWTRMLSLSLSIYLSFYLSISLSLLFSLKTDMDTDTDTDTDADADTNTGESRHRREQTLVCGRAHNPFSLHTLASR